MVLVDLPRNVYQKFTGHLSATGVFTAMFFAATTAITCAQNLVDDDECFRTADDFPVFCPGALRKSSVKLR